jgi:hypothetical protein
LSTTFCLRVWVVPKSMVGSLASMPKVPAWPTVRYTAAVSSSSLAGMQPRCRHVPPTRSRSTMPIDRPAAAPYSAAA